MPEITPFCFNDSMVRTLTIDGDPWFVAKDVCEVLGLQWKGSDTTGPLDEDERGSALLTTSGGPQEMVTVSESGLYALIFKSRKPQAKAFRRWVTHEVLPSIRKTGGYAQEDSKRKTDIFHHRGPVSGSGLDIRYTLDLTKIVLRPTQASLDLLQRLTGIDLGDLAERSARIRTGREPEDSVGAFLAEQLVEEIGARLRLSSLYASYRQWCAGVLSPGTVPHVRTLSAYLRDHGYTVKKHGQMVVYDVALRE